MPSKHRKIKKIFVALRISLSTSTMLGIGLRGWLQRSSINDWEDVKKKQQNFAFFWIAAWHTWKPHHSKLFSWASFQQSAPLCYSLWIKLLLELLRLGTEGSLLRSCCFTCFIEWGYTEEWEDCVDGEPETWSIIQEQLGRCETFWNFVGVDNNVPATDTAQASLSTCAALAWWSWSSWASGKTWGSCPRKHC